MKYLRWSLKQLCLLVFGLVLLSSCEKEAYIDYFIDNQSSVKITVNGNEIIHSTDIDEIIQANERKHISSWQKYGNETDWFEPTSIFGNDFIIANASGDTLIKDDKLLEHWSADVDNARAVATLEYVLLVTDSDF